MAARRPLRFDRLDRVMPDVDRLLEGHETVGRWSLGQICNHLAGAVLQSVEGSTHRAPWLFRKLAGPIIRRKILRDGRMPEGVKVPRQFLPEPGKDARDEAEALRVAIGRFVAMTGPPADNPLFGPTTRRDWERLHLIHCAHHLSFAIPTVADGQPS